MKRLVVATYRTDAIAMQEGAEIIVIDEKNIHKCRGCLACRRVGHCINFEDDAQLCIPLFLAADHLDIYLQPEGNIQRLVDRVLYALNGVGKTFTLHIEDSKETDYLRRLLLWAKYTEVQ
jgi:hypothetical protein